MHIKSNLHTHTVYSDGVNTPEEMVLAAIGRGFVSLGFSEHGPAPYDVDCAIKPEDVDTYCLEIGRLREKYEGQIELYLGLEVDMLNPVKDGRLDYTIGSVHYIAGEDGVECCIDHTLERFLEAARRFSGGDTRPLVEKYYGMVGDMAENFKPDIVGHFDVIARLNKSGSLFDENSKWYNDAALGALERISKTGCIMEINTGGIRRGYQTEPYPPKKFLPIMREMDIPIIISSDAHSTEYLDFWFDEAVGLLLDAGYRSVKRLQGGGFADIELAFNLQFMDNKMGLYVL